MNDEFILKARLSLVCKSDSYLLRLYNPSYKIVFPYVEYIES